MELTKTVAGNRVDYVEITNKLKNDKKKKSVFFTARVHPGESNSSWVMKGLIEFLISDSSEARILRDAFVFHLVPMLNPDGVINGNYRCSLVGQDLNRKFKTNSKILHPEISALKKLTRECRKQREIVFYCDFHGHSRNKNIFVYGNDYSD